MNSETDLPQRIPHTLELPPIDPIEPPPVELLLSLATALDEWDPEGHPDRPYRPGCHLHHPRPDRRPNHGR